MTTKARAARAPLKLEPTFRRVEDGRDAYVGLPQLRALAKKAKRWWTFHGAPTTVEMDEQRYAKNIGGFTHHLEDERGFLEFLRECDSHGVPRPAGYSDVFHKHFFSPRVAWSVNATLAPALAGGWQEALSPGIHRGEFRRYDIRSAYMWAGSLGLPDVRTYRCADRVSKYLPGCYRVRLEYPVPGTPYPFSRAHECLATDEEIELYSLPVVKVVSGVTWSRSVDPEKMLAAIRRISLWKAAARSYWGRWGQTARVECHVSSGKSWTLPNPAANIPAAALIIARVKAKLWTYAADAVHVYVDSLITPRKLPTGEAVGDFKLEHLYERGVVIKAPGWYGEPGKPLEKMAGVPKNSPLREIWADANPELLAG